MGKPLLRHSSAASSSRWVRVSAATRRSTAARSAEGRPDQTPRWCARQAACTAASVSAVSASLSQASWPSVAGLMTGRRWAPGAHHWPSIQEVMVSGVRLMA